MSYYIRVLSPTERVPDLQILQSALKESGVTATLAVEDEGEDGWSQLVLAHADGAEIAIIERNAASSDELFAEEMEEFAEEIDDCLPVSARLWLLDYFPRVRTIYAFQLLDGTDHNNGWDALGAVQSALHDAVGGIHQADGEGFSNEDRYHILWQFAEGVDGPWSMSVLSDGEWKCFEMDLGNSDHRAAFLRGEVPAGVTIME